MWQMLIHGGSPGQPGITTMIASTVTMENIDITKSTGTTENINTTDTDHIKTTIDATPHTNSDMIDTGLTGISMDLITENLIVTFTTETDKPMSLIHTLKLHCHGD